MTREHGHSGSARYAESLSRTLCTRLAFQNPGPIRNASSGIRLRQMSMSRSDLAPTTFDAYTRRRIAPPSTAHADPGLVREEGQRQPHLPLVDARSFAG
jgi:hypothetical protein